MLRATLIPCIFKELSPLNYFFPIIDASPGHVLERAKGIEIKLGTYINVNERKYSRQEPLSYFVIKFVFIVMSWCTSGVGLQVTSNVRCNSLIYSCQSPVYIYRHVCTLVCV